VEVVRSFEARIHALRPYQGQIVVAENIRRLIEGSEIMQSHKSVRKFKTRIRFVVRRKFTAHAAMRWTTLAAVIEIELNSATDNPLVFENGDVISGGNFHGEPLALALDMLAIALSELASISERRIYLLLGGDSVGGIDLPNS
jgi:histidine ammonia-lyase